MSEHLYNELDIAIIGMAGRFPDADTVDALWQNVCRGHNAAVSLSEETLKCAGVTEKELTHANFVNVGIPFADKDQFDAQFFGYSPTEATQLDPQQRLFLQTCWHALEHAGLTAAGQFTGVYAGCGFPTYLINNLLPRQQDKDITSLLALTNSNEKDALATRVSYELDLTGPAVTVQTACSTSLVAVHMACRALQNYECDAALAGGVWLNLFDEQGYLAPAGGSLSPSGKLSAFGANADGIVIGSGSAAVVLKRMGEALASGDPILAVIKGSAINNDGRDKIGYTAPSVTGQTNAIQAALQFADVEPRSIGYIETHGTGTVLGDPIEIAALTKAYASADKQYCAIGSIKANIGHLDAAAGVTGLIKAIQALRFRTIPPSINSHPSNPKIDFANSPFYLPQESQPWESATVRRAAVSSLGMGGTNAHVILEEYSGKPQAQPLTESKWQLFPLSATSDMALKKQASAVHSALLEHPLAWQQLAGQLQHQRRHFSTRAVVVAQNSQQAVAYLSRPDLEVALPLKDKRVGILFSGQGSQYVTMAQPLLRDVPAFKQAYDTVMACFPATLQVELQQVFFPSDDQILAANQLLNQTRVTQPALFAVGYAMAKTYQAFGIQIEAMLGHSVGQYVAACLADVMSLQDAARLVTVRGEVLQLMAPGAMLSVMAPAQTLHAYLTAELDIAALNSPRNTVVAGSKEAIKALQAQLTLDGISCTRLHVSHAFHSYLTEAVLPLFAQALQEVTLGAPSRPFVSDLTGTWITAAEATSAQYWLDHIRQPVSFMAGVNTLAERCQVLIEAGPGDTLQTLAKQCLGTQKLIFHSIAHVRDVTSPIPPFVKTMAKLWQHGIDIAWQQFSAVPREQVMLAPLYPFSDTRFWQSANKSTTTVENAANLSVNTGPELLAPSWQQWVTTANTVPRITGQNWLVICTDHPILTLLQEKLASLAINCIWVWPTEGEFAAINENSYRVNVNHKDSLNLLVEQRGQLDRVVDLRLIAEQSVDGYALLLPLYQWVAQKDITLSVLAANVFSVLGSEFIEPNKAMVLGLSRTIGHEYPNLSTQLLEIDVQGSSHLHSHTIAAVVHFLAETRETEVAIRGRHGFKLTQQRLAFCEAPVQTPQETPVTLITGGLGGVGLIFAEALAKQGHRLALLSRRQLPGSAAWAALAEQQEDTVQASFFARLQALSYSAAGLLVLEADVTDKASLDVAIDLTESTLGPITQVIHAAGEAGGGMLSQLSVSQVTDIMAAKIRGTDNLLAVFADKSLSVMVLCSSLATVIGAFGQGDYCAANAYLDAVALQSHPFPIQVINWDVWAGIGMAAEHSIDVALGLNADTGITLYNQASNSGLVQVYALAMSWDARAAQVQALLADMAVAAVPLQVEQGRARPALETEFIAAEGELELKLAALWCQTLGFSEVGIFDSFFTLGGDSLMAIQMIAKAKQQFAIDLQPAIFFEDPCIDNLAYSIEEALLAKA